MRPAIVLVVGVLSLVGVPPRAGADGAADQARAVATRGTEAAASGDLRGAITLFKQARALDDRAEYLCNVGYAYQLLGELPRAHLFLSECLVRAAAMEATVADSFRGRLGDVEAALRAGGFAPVDVTVVPRGAEVGASVFDDDETAPGPRILWLPPGRHTLTAAATGHQRRAVEIDVAGTERHAVSIELAPAIVEVPPRRNRTPALVALAGGGVAVAAGGVFHALALGTRDDIAQNFPTEGSAREAREATWKRQVTGMTIGYGVGAVALGVGAYLWWKSGRGPRPLRAPAGGDGPGAATLGWRF